LGLSRLKSSARGAATVCAAFAFSALFVIIRDKKLPIATNVLYQVFSPCGDVESIARLRTMDDVHARVNFIHPKML